MNDVYKSIMAGLTEAVEDAQSSRKKVKTASEEDAAAVSECLVKENTEEYNNLDK